MDKEETQHIAKLARLRFEDDELANVAEQMTGILKWVDMLQSADTSAVAIISGDEKPLRTRKDEVRTAGLSDELIKNAPEPHEHFFAVPKMVE